MSPDVRYLARAWALAARGAATCSPNPAVGCVLVRDGEVVGEGWHARAGGPHAEVAALAAAGTAARGATAYVTLEPCDHTGRTGPCSVALLTAGVRRVVVASRDPLEGEGGADRLRSHGVTVDRVDLQGWDGALAERFLRRDRTGRPWVTLKLALAADGATSLPDGGWITGEIARTRVHAQRSQHDAVLVGVGTVLADDPALTVRHVPHERAQPRPVVLDSEGRTPPDAVVVRRGALVLVGDGAAAERLRALEVAGAEVVAVARTSEDRVALPAVFDALAQRRLLQVYAEPGATLATFLVRAGAVDEVVLHHPAAAPATGPLAALVAGWRHVRSLPLGRDREDAYRELVPGFDGAHAGSAGFGV